ncbi:hypothetical protein ACOME3_006355 [Neoechinorhynchus agilis]
MLELTCRRSPHFTGRHKKRASALIIHAYLFGQSLAGLITAVLSTIQRYKCSHLNCTIVRSMDQPNYFPSIIKNKPQMMFCQQNLVGHLRFSVSVYMMFTEAVVFLSFVGFIYLHKRLHSGRGLRQVADQLDEHDQYVEYEAGALHFDLRTKKHIVVMAMVSTFLIDGIMPLFEHYGSATANVVDYRIILVNLASLATVVGVAIAVMLRLFHFGQSIQFGYCSLAIGVLICSCTIFLSALFPSRTSSKNDLVIMILLITEKLILESVKAQCAIKVHSTARKQLMFWLGSLEEMSGGIGLIISFFISRFAIKMARTRTPCHIVCDLADLKHD